MVQWWLVDHWNAVKMTDEYGEMMSCWWLNCASWWFMRVYGPTIQHQWWLISLMRVSKVMLNTGEYRGKTHERQLSEGDAPEMSWIAHHLKWCVFVDSACKCLRATRIEGSARLSVHHTTQNVTEREALDLQTQQNVSDVFTSVTILVPILVPAHT